MIAPTPAADLKHDADAALVPLLMILTVITGLVDAVSYLKLGQVFVANMTGNVVFLGFAVAGAQGFSIAASLVAIASFLAGALAGGRLGLVMAQHRGRFLVTAIFVKVGLVGAAAAAAIAVSDKDTLQYVLIVLLAFAMGLQNATARSLAVPDMTTTVLTLTLTGIAADSSLAGGQNVRFQRRFLAACAMFLGAAIGAILVLRLGTAVALATTFVLLCLNAVAAWRVWSRSQA